MRALGRHDAGDAGGGEHVALRSISAQDQVQRLRRHGDETLGGGAPLRDRLLRDIDHARLAGLVQMAQAARGHCAASRCLTDAPVRSVRVASATSACRIRLSPTRKAPTPDAASLVKSAWVKMPLSAMTMRSFGTRGAKRLGDGEIGDEGLEVAVVDADEPGVEPKCAVELRRIMHFGEHVHAEIMRGSCKLTRRGVVNRRHDDQDAVGAQRPRLEHLIGIDHEVLAQRRQARRLTRRRQKFRPSLKRWRVGQHRETGGAAGLDRPAPAPEDRNRRGSAPSTGSPS